LHGRPLAICPDALRARIGRIDMRRDQLTAFAASLLSTDVVVVEATGNAAVAAVISPHVRRVVIANPMQVRGWPMSRSRPTPLMPASWPSSVPVGCSKIRKGAHGRSKRGATIKAARQGLHLKPCSLPQSHPCARGEYTS
jgi:hypothetical protein